MAVPIPDYLPAFSTVASILLLGCVLSLIFIAATRVQMGIKERVTTVGMLIVGLAGWFAVAEFLGQNNVYRSAGQFSISTIQFGILIPIVVGLWLLTRSARVASLVDALPMSWLVGIQFYRALGFMFIVLWLEGYLPWQFAVPAGIGDVATGVLALVVAGMIAVRANGAERAVYAWCLFGIADLVVAITMGALTSPGRINFVSQEAPNMLVTAYPLVMIPTFAVPLSIILHGLCLWKLRRASQ